MARVLDDLVVKLALLTLPVWIAVLMSFFAAFHPAARDLAMYSFATLVGIQSAAALLGTIPILTSRGLSKPWKALTTSGYLVVALAGGIFLAFISFCVAAHCE